MTASQILDLFLEAVHHDPCYSGHEESYAPCLFIEAEIRRDPAMLARLRAFLEMYREDADTEDDEEDD